MAFTIVDHGRGMSRDQLEHLFEPFMQVDGSMTRQLGGTGLGLTLARKFARALGGDVVLLSTEPSKGSTFQVTIDPGEVAGVERISVLETTFDETSNGKADESYTAANASLRPAPQKKQVDLHGVKILLVEDSPENQFLMKRFLEFAGATIDLASNGQEGVEMALHHTYDIVLMDIQMPVLDGYNATTRLRATGYDRPIVALTAHALKEEREKCLRLGFSGFLTKPIRKDDLLKEVDGFIA
ncbi:MAG: response regulator [Bdellovibrionota bacterium]